MLLTRTELDEFQITVTGEELTTIQNGLNEALEAIDDWEFPTRMGVEVAFARALLDELNTAPPWADRRVDPGKVSDGPP